MYKFGPVLGPEVCCSITWVLLDVLRHMKFEIPAKEAELTFLHEIVNNVEKFQIPSSLVLNLDQTNSKYVCMGKTTMAKKGSNSAPISGMSGKRSMN